MVRSRREPVPAGEAAKRTEATVVDVLIGHQRWAPIVTVLVAIILQFTLPDTLTFGPRLLPPLLEGALLVPLLLTTMQSTVSMLRYRRALALALIALVNVDNLFSLVALIHFLIKSATGIDGHHLLLSSIQIWFTNVLIFGLWYWELDRGGPAARNRVGGATAHPDFLFPQMVTPGAASRGWQPSFLDYQYVSLTNAMAFSPTDTMPLTPWAKLLMMVQALASLLVVVLVAARAVNILG